MKPILFNGEMVRAILDGRKTVTRRVMKPQPLFFTGRRYVFADDEMPKKWEDCNDFVGTYQYQPGDTLYVRETWAKISDWTDVDAEVGMSDGYIYKADWADAQESPRWCPSIHMPRDAARIFLRVTNVRVERLHDVRLKDCLAEGVILTSSEIDDCVKAPIRARERFAAIWDGTVKPADLPRYGWNANPWVWVIEFEKITKQEVQS